MKKILIIAVLLASCAPPAPPVCQSAAGRYARVHGLTSVSIACARLRGDEAPCTLSYRLPGLPDAIETISLMCGESGCECIGGCP